MTNDLKYVEGEYDIMKYRSYKPAMVITADFDEGTKKGYIVCRLSDMAKDFQDYYGAIFAQAPALLEWCYTFIGETLIEFREDLRTAPGRSLGPDEIARIEKVHNQIGVLLGVQRNATDQKTD